MIRITYESVARMIGRAPEKSVFAILALICEGNNAEVCELLSRISYEELSPKKLWEMLIELCNILIRWHHGIKKGDNMFYHYEDDLSVLSLLCPLELALKVSTILWEGEATLLLTSHKHIFFEEIVQRSCTACCN